MNKCQMIRMMDCETLATFILEKLIGDCDFCPAWKRSCWETDMPHLPSHCKENMVEWLQSEASE